MSTETDRLIGLVSQPTAPPPGPGPPPYLEQPLFRRSRHSCTLLQSPGSSSYMADLVAVPVFKPQATVQPSAAPYTAPPRGHQHPHYAAPPPPYGQPHPHYAAPPPPQVQPHSHYGSAPGHNNMTIVQTRVNVDVKPRNYIILSLLTAICFCPLCGCLALYFALQANSAWDAGDRVKARQNLKRAVRLSLTGIIIGVLLVGVCVIYALIVALVHVQHV